MQLRLPWTAPLERARVVEAGGRTFPVEFTRHRRARRYILRLTSAGVVRVTVPRGASLAGGLRFASGQAGWIAAEWARRRVQAEWAPGTEIWYRGVRHALVTDGDVVACGSSRLPVGGDNGDLRATFHARWRFEATRELPARCMQLGEPHGLRPARVQVRNQQSRWGSCSTSGTIALNWRLLQMPDEVADYVMLHELVHLEHPNHSTRFWRRVAVVCPWWRTAERWLKTHGRELL